MNSRGVPRCAPGRPAVASPIVTSASRALLLAALAVAAVLGLLPAAGALAANAPIVVTLASDEPDAKPADGTCEIDEKAPRGCTLRAAIQHANATPGADTVTFQLPGTAPKLTPQTAYPPVTDQLTIDGRTQSGYDATSGVPVVEIDGSAVPKPADLPNRPADEIQTPKPYGMEIRATNSTVRALALHSFPTVQLGVESASGVAVLGSTIGLARGGSHTTGQARVGLLLRGTGSALVGGPTADERNTFAGNEVQVLIGTIPGGGDHSTFANTIFGNRVGTTVDGQHPLPGVADDQGILVSRATGQNMPHALLTSVTGNLVAAQDVGIATFDAVETRINGNSAGLSNAGTAKDALGASFANGTGIAIEGESVDTLVGGPEPQDGNRVASSADAGVAVGGTSRTTELRSNLIGTNFQGDSMFDPLGNPMGNRVGVLVRGGAAAGPAQTLVGHRTEPAQGNVIGTSEVAGVLVDGAASDVTIANDLIGGDRSGQSGFGNRVGVRVGTPDRAAPAGVKLGVPGAGNVITDSGAWAVQLLKGTGTTIQANDIGLTRAGELAGNAQGVRIEGAGTKLGGDAPGEGNTIAGTRSDAVQISGEADDTSVLGNVVGLGHDEARKDGRGFPLRNEGTGVLVTGTPGTRGPRGTRIGGAPAGRNVIGNNLGDGVRVAGPAPGTVVAANLIGSDTEQRDAGNDGAGVKLDGTSGVFVGGPDEEQRNLISSNGGDGVEIRGGDGNVLIGNIVGGAEDVWGNGGAGVRVADGATRTRIGAPKEATLETGCTPGRCNRIGHNAEGGIRVEQNAGAGTTFRGNAFESNGLADADIAGEGMTGNVVGGDEHVNAPAGVRVGTRADGGMVVSGELPAIGGERKPQGAVIDVHGTNRRNQRGTDAEFLVSTKPDAHGAWRVPIAADDDGFAAYTATATWGDGTTSEFGVVCADERSATQDGNPDSDGDGLCDSWEVDGVDFDGDGQTDADLAADGASPLVRDLFVEVDEMEGVDVPDAAFTKVASAFADAPADARGNGIHLHFAGGTGSPYVNEKVPAVDRITVKERGAGALDDAADYLYGRGGPTACDGRLGTAGERGDDATCSAVLGARKLTHRYALLAKELNAPAGGYADPAGHGFVVGAGGKYARESFNVAAGGAWASAARASSATPTRSPGRSCTSSATRWAACTAAATPSPTTSPTTSAS